MRAVLTKLEKLAVKEAQIVNAATYALVREGESSSRRVLFGMLTSLLELPLTEFMYDETGIISLCAFNLSVRSHHLV